MNPKSSQNKFLKFLVALVMFMEMLDSTALNSSLPQIARDLGVLPVHLSLAITSYMFVLAVLIPATAYVVDRFGEKNALYFALITFMLGSIGCGLSQSVHELVFFRFIQGCGGAFMLPVGRLVIAKIFHETYVQAMSTVTSISLIGPMVGPVLGGFLTTYLSWHWIFFINVPLAIFGLWLLYRHFPNIPFDRHKRFDLAGFLILFIGMSAVFFSSEIFKQKPAYDLEGFFTVVSGIALLAGYLFYANRHAQPLIEIKVFKNLRFTAIVIGNFLVRFAIGAFPFLIPIFLFYKLQLDAFQTGLSILPMIFGTWIMKYFIPAFLKNRNAHLILIFNTVVLAVIESGFAIIVLHWNMAAYVAYALVLGMSISVQFASMNSLMFFSLTNAEKSHGNAIYLSLTQLGSSLGVSIAASLINYFRVNQQQNFLGFVAASLVLSLLTLSSLLAFLSFDKNHTA